MGRFLKREGKRQEVPTDRKQIRREREPSERRREEKCKECTTRTRRRLHFTREIEASALILTSAGAESEN